MTELQYFRGLKGLYNKKAHGEGIYFATDSKEIIHNGLIFSGSVPAELSEVIAKAEANRVALEILNGSGEGSVQKQIDDAINEFTSQISDNGTIDTFKELLEFAANNKGEIGDLILEINEAKDKNEEQDLRIESLENNLKATEQGLLLKIEGNETAIANLSTEIDTKIESAFSWENVN